MENIKIVDSWWNVESLSLYLQYSIGDKRINLIFSIEIVADHFYNNMEKDMEKAKNNVIVTIETKDDKLKYLIKEALEDEKVQKQLARKEIGQFTVKTKHIDKDYRQVN